MNDVNQCLHDLAVSKEMMLARRKPGALRLLKAYLNAHVQADARALVPLAMEGATFVDDPAAFILGSSIVRLDADADLAACALNTALRLAAIVPLMRQPRRYASKRAGTRVVNEGQPSERKRKVRHEPCPTCFVFVENVRQHHKRGNCANHTAAIAGFLRVEEETVRRERQQFYNDWEAVRRSKQARRKNNGRS